MTLRKLFPTLVYDARLRGRAAPELNNRLVRECRQLYRDDAAGRRWSAKNYPGGYTSYNSVSRMHEVSPTFSELERQIDRHVALFTRALGFDLRQRALSMIDCWVNIMPRGSMHGLHLHPLATLSGTYYVRAPAGAPGLKLEDPRLDRFMATPPLRAGSRYDNRRWVIVPARTGSLVMFESWLRHEVSPNPVAAERISISFNYGWF